MTSIQRCPAPAILAIGSSDGTVLACPGHALEAMQEVAGRDGLGVFWPTNGQCFAQVTDAATLPDWPTCSVCGIRRGPDHPDSDHPWQWLNPRQQASHA